MMLDWADRLDMLERGHVEQASLHLPVADRDNKTQSILINVAQRMRIVAADY